MDNSQDELLDIVNENNQIIGQALRRECHKNPKLMHRAVHVLVFNSKSELYLQKRSLNKDIQPGKWDTSVGGHLQIGESYEVAARREMKEELGIETNHLSLLYDYQMHNNVESESIKTFITFYDDTIIPDLYEISEGRFFTLTEISNLLNKNFFTPNFEEEFKRYMNYNKINNIQQYQ